MHMGGVGQGDSIRYLDQARGAYGQGVERWAKGVREAPTKKNRLKERRTVKGQRESEMQEQRYLEQTRVTCEKRLRRAEGWAEGV